MIIDPLHLREIVRHALREDIGWGDRTTRSVLPQPPMDATGNITTREDCVVAGIGVAEVIFAILSGSARTTTHAVDGDAVKAGDRIFTVDADAATILSGERTALNFLMRMSGIATATRRFVRQIEGNHAKIVDTRKTAPGLRLLDKFAVKAGGGRNHRFGLDDGILIKDNHITLAGGIRAAVVRAKAAAPHSMRIEVEVRDLEQLETAIESGADAVLLDNMAPEMMRRAVEIAAGRVLLEASGGINEENVREVAETGVDLISIGALTHSPRSIDMTMAVTPRETDESKA
ncbi:MAG TPA: carboxylating nicotinate-nucleotide diphosphorylase [Acidobacteriota bacterium]|nr:carboxylating nicotinate-nucleotide diphosphorylase [Acidobacteriota bacterium]